MSHRATGDQYFHLMDFDIFFDVGMAKQVVGFPHAAPDCRLPLTTLRWALLGVEVDQDHITNTDLRKPLILGTVGEWKFLLDGHHRLTKALRRRRTRLPCYVLDGKETRRTCSSRAQYDIMTRLVRGLPIPLFSAQFQHYVDEDGTPTHVIKVPPTRKLEVRG